MTATVANEFTAESTAADVIEGVDLTGRRAIVTGGASGIGVETARALAQAGASVTIAARDVDAAQRVAARIATSTGNDRVLPAYLDLADPASIAAFVSTWDGPLHILVNNAGVMGPPETRTAQGWELQFATNHLGHFALAGKLRRALSVADGARVVSVSSSAHLRAPVMFSDIHFRERAYDPAVAYGQSKTANVLFAVAATARWADDGIAVNALMPGAIRTNLQRFTTDAELARLRARAGGPSAPAWKTPEQGAATSVLLAASPLVTGVSGRYFEDCAEAEPHRPGSRRGVAAHALDPDAADRLWRISTDLLRC